jgi:hypothetical protein
MMTNEEYCMKYSFPISGGIGCKCGTCPCLHCAEQYCERNDPTSACSRKSNEMSRFDNERCVLAGRAFQNVK